MFILFVGNAPVCLFINANAEVLFGPPGAPFHSFQGACPSAGWPLRLQAVTRGLKGLASRVAWRCQTFWMQRQREREREPEPRAFVRPYQNL